MATKISEPNHLPHYVTFALALFYVLFHSVVAHTLISFPDIRTLLWFEPPIYETLVQHAHNSSRFLHELQ